jgi:hypothetical protein
MGQKEMAVKKTAKTRTHFAYRIDIWSKPKGDSLVEHVAAVEDYHVALATTAPQLNAGLARPLPCDKARE